MQGKLRLRCAGVYETVASEDDRRPVQKLAIEYLLATKERYPDNVAFVEGGSRVTYAELWLRVLALSRGSLVGSRGSPDPSSFPSTNPSTRSSAILAVQLSGHNV